MIAIDIIGAGAFGTALAITFAKAGHPVTLWARTGAAIMQTARQNMARLPGYAFPDRLTVTDDLTDLTASTVLLALPTQSLAAFLANHRLTAQRIISCAKGIDLASGRGPTALISAAHPNVVVAQLTGPSFATDIAAGLPTALTLACADDRHGTALQTALSTPALRLYRTTDVIGAEMGGALKNVMALAAGIVIGRGLGESARAALMARGFEEMRRIALHHGADPATLHGLSGFGDLVLTCTSEKSRNFCAGLAIGQGAPLDPSLTVEGVATAASLTTHKALDTPICDCVYRLVNGLVDFDEAFETLLNRPLKPE
jgi:glycerol-3-phosphate dehydrogenase (NAD(P)+)